MESWFDEEMKVLQDMVKEDKVEEPAPTENIDHTSVSCSWMQPSPSGDDGAFLPETPKTKQKLTQMGRTTQTQSPAAHALMAAQTAAQAAEVRLPRGCTPIKSENQHLITFGFVYSKIPLIIITVQKLVCYMVFRKTITIIKSWASIECPASSFNFGTLPYMLFNVRQPPISRSSKQQPLGLQPVRQLMADSVVSGAG